MIVDVNVAILQLIIRFRDVCFRHCFLMKMSCDDFHYAVSGYKTTSFKNGFWKLNMQSLKMEKEKTDEGIKFNHILLNLIWVFLNDEASSKESRRYK